MLPLLELAGDSQEHTLSEAIEILAEKFSLTDADRRELLSSGIQPRYDNRVGWARTYLKKAGLLQTPSRGRFRITERGLQVLKSNPRQIDARFLRQYPEFVEFQTVSRASGKHEAGEEAGQTPEEVLESSYQGLRSDLAQELLERIKKCSPKFFETLVVKLLVAMGYGGSLQDAGQAIGQSGDGGIDGTIKEDTLGLDVVYVQAKRWEATVGRPIVQAFAGSLEGVRARKGVLITTSRFSPDARDYATRIEKKIVLIDGEQLAQLMIDHDIGVAEVARYIVKRVDLDYFAEE
jgi:restriction system protein